MNITRRKALASALSFASMPFIGKSNPVKSILGTRSMLIDDQEFSIPTASNYVQDGLIAVWDGIENAGWNIHDDFASTWIDLTENGFNLSIANGAQFESNCLNTHGIAKAAFINNTQDFISLIKSFGTVFMFNQHLPENGLTPLRFIHARKSLSTGKISIGETWNENKQSMTINRRTLWDFDNDLHSVNCNADDINNVDFATLDGHVIDYFANERVGEFSNGLAIGSSNNGGNIQSGKLYNLRIYDRKLTNEELQYNYMIDKIRFGV